MPDKEIKTLEDVWIDKAKFCKNVVGHNVQMMKDVMKFHRAYSTEDNQQAIKSLQEAKLCIEDAISYMIKSRDYLKGKIGIVDNTNPDDQYLAVRESEEPVEVRVINSLKEVLPDKPPAKKVKNKHGIVLLKDAE
jgi:hypothetical protein